jgi:hypothetical protein
MKMLVQDKASYADVHLRPSAGLASFFRLSATRAGSYRIPRLLEFAVAPAGRSADSYTITRGTKIGCSCRLRIEEYKSKGRSRALFTTDRVTAPKMLSRTRGSRHQDAKREPGITVRHVKRFCALSGHLRGSLTTTASNPTRIVGDGAAATADKSKIRDR